MRIIKIIGFLTAINIFSAPVFCVLHAGEKAKLTLNECIELARKNSEELKMQTQRRIQSETRLRQARGNVLPDIRYNYLKTYRDDAGGQYSDGSEESKFTLSQPIFAGFQKVEAIALAKSGTKLENLKYQSALTGLELQVTLVYYGIVQVQADIVNLQSVKKLFNDRLKELDERARLGKSRESEAFVVESQIAALIAQEEKAGGDLDNALAALSFLTGLDSGNILIAESGNLAEQVLEPEEKYLQIAMSRPSIETVKQEIESQRYRAMMARGAMLPSLTFDGSYYANRGGSYPLSKWDALLSLDFPLFQGGFLRARVEEERSKLKEAQELLSQAGRQTDTLIRQMYKAAVSSAKQAQAYKLAYEKAQSSYMMQLKDYRYGLVNNLDVIQAMTSMLDSKRNYDKASIQYRIDKAALEITVRQ